MSEAQEVKRLWFAQPLPPAILYSETAKFDQPCFRGINRPLKKARARLSLASVWDHSTFSQNHDRLFNQDVARLFFQRIKSLDE